MELMFHAGTSSFYEEDGVTLKSEPSYSLDELLARYESTKEDHKKIAAQIKAEEAKYKDWDEWEEKDPIGFFRAGMFEENGHNILDKLEWDIDLKIMHINSVGQNV